MKRQHEEHTERDEREAWARLPKPTQRNTEPADHFDATHVYARDEGVDLDRAHGATRGEVETTLQRLRLSKNEQSVLLAVVFDGLDSGAATGRKTGLHRHTVEAILNRPKVRQCLKDLRRGTLATPQDTPTKAEGLPGLLADLREILANERQAAWEYCGTRQILRYDQSPTGAVEHVFQLRSKLRDVTDHCPPEAFARKIVACIRDYPATLTHGKGLPWAGALVELQTAAKTGEHSGLVPGLLPEGRGNHVRKAARDALELQKPAKRGNPIEYAPHPVRVAFVALCGRLAALQHEHRATVGQQTKAERLAALREAHPTELTGFADADLQSILNRKPLAVAVELAANASGASPDYWRDLYTYCARKMPPEADRDHWERAECYHREQVERYHAEIERAISGKDPCKPKPSRLSKLNNAFGRLPSDVSSYW